MSIIEHIRKQQQALAQIPIGHIPPHDPSVLLVACIDARKDIESIGFYEDDTAVLRNIAATIAANDGSEESRQQEKALKDAIGNGIRHIVVMGHTNCGGLEACLCGHDHALPAVRKHLEPYQDIRRQAIEQHGDPNELLAKGGSIAHISTDMAHQAVHLSIDNLMTYDVVKEAVKKGLQIHGWVIDTGSGIIHEWDREAGTFHRMIPPDHANASDVINRVHARQGYIKDEDVPPPPHNPTMLIMGDMAGPITAGTLNIPYGEALIYRDHDPSGATLTTGQEAALQFAIKAKEVKDIVLTLHTDSSRHKGEDGTAERNKKEAMLRIGIKKLKDYPLIAQALEDHKIELHGWLIDASTHLIDEMDLKTRASTPMSALSTETWSPEIPVNRRI